MPSNIPAALMNDSQPSEVEASPPAMLPVFTRAQVASLSSMDRVLVILFNSVYDLTEFVDLHPGGGSVLAAYIGREATGAFEAIGHSVSAHEWAKKFLVGKLPAEEHI